MTSHLNDGLRRNLALGGFFFGLFLKKKNMRKQMRRISRTVKVNKASKPSAKQLKVRKKRAPVRNATSRRACAGVKTWRASLDDVGRQIRSAIEQAGQHYRNAVRGYKKVRPKVREILRQRHRKAEGAFIQSPKFETLLKLIKPQDRIKPDNAGQKVVFVLPKDIDAHSWMCSEVVKVAPHKESNWIIVKKPWTLKPKENPFVAVDVLNVFVKPEGFTDRDLTLLPNKGV